ncbi:MAG TPA: cysteine peptidase family C39 domain-containing protein [Longimicrobiaceae bacterium]|nr:cysteine peptidase family C39 domain-containing protein [Longimicrobiaceae bacterium]
MTETATTIPEERTEDGGRIAHELLVQRILQPDDVTCGPTCLRKVYQYYGLELELAQVLGEIDRNEDGGTLAVFLGIAALRREFRARLYAYDLRIFDPSWFDIPMPELAEKVHRRIPFLTSAKTIRAARAYLEFLELGGEVAFEELTPGLLKEILDRDHPILAGLSATYLYRWKRERQLEELDELVPDDVRGEPTGHFIVIAGYEQWGRRFSLRDPSAHVPDADEGRQVVDAQRLINSILLGDLTYDAVLLELWRGDAEGSPA